MGGCDGLRASYTVLSLPRLVTRAQGDSKSFGHVGHVPGEFFQFTGESHALWRVTSAWSVTCELYCKNTCAAIFS
jgi:hypothetical protein